MTRFAAVLVLVPAVMFLGCEEQPDEVAQKPAKPYQTQPAQQTQGGEYEGDLVAVHPSLEPYEGKVVLLDFWATWCGPCKAAMPSIQRVHETFSGQPVAVVGANCWERGDPQAYMESQGYTYNLMMGADELAQQFNVTGIPTFVILSPDGEVAYRAVGANPAHEKEIIRVINEELAEHNL